jgi:hypothetical protein
MRQHPGRVRVPWALLILPAVVVLGCRRETTPKLEVKSEATETIPDGKKVTKTESTQIGSTLVKETTTTATGAAGSGKSDVNTYVGTVVSYVAGKSLDVLTGESDHHRVDLSRKDTTVDVDPSVAVGNKVRLVDAKDEQGHRTVTVSPAR